LNSKNVLTVATVVTFAILATSCKKKGGGYLTEPVSVPVTAVKVTPQVIQLAAIGESQQLSATVGPVEATDRTIIWESTNPTIVSVDSIGRVTARAFGAGVFITAYSHDRQHQASANVSVNP
jgi:uncharacterized protein YjdB